MPWNVPRWRPWPRELPAGSPGGRARSDFAANRRCSRKANGSALGSTRTGPPTTSLPVLKVTDLDGKVRAVLMNYACHCTTLGGEFNQICAEWAGYACDDIERHSRRGPP